MNKKTFVIIPAFNEEQSVGAVVKGALRNGHITCCVVVDDCSSDKTASVALKAGAHVIRKNHNEGTGAATKTGLAYAMKHGADAVIFMDADGQHDPKYIQLLLSEAQTHDMVIGSRYIQPTANNTSSLRKLGTKIISLLIRLRYEKQVYDPTSGFRLVNKKALQYLSNHYPTVFPEPEATIGLIRRGYMIKEVSVCMKPRIFGRSSISSWDACRLMAYIVGVILMDTMHAQYNVGT